MNARERFDSPAWATAAATLASYGLVLLFMFVLLFAVPFFVYTSLVA